MKRKEKLKRQLPLLKLRQELVQGVLLSVKLMLKHQVQEQEKLLDHTEVDALEELESEIYV
jgi:hypothetical protein